MNSLNNLTDSILGDSDGKIVRVYAKLTDKKFQIEKTECKVHTIDGNSTQILLGKDYTEKEIVYNNQFGVILPSFVRDENNLWGAFAYVKEKDVDEIIAKLKNECLVFCKKIIKLKRKI